MSSSCTIEKTLSGDANIIYEKILYLQRELEKRGLNVEITNKNEEKNDRYNLPENNTGNLSIPKFSSPKFSSPNFSSPNFSSPSIPKVDVFGRLSSRLDNIKFNSTNITYDPNDITKPYIRFKEVMDRVLVGGRVMMDYKIRSVIISIKVE